MEEKEMEGKGRDQNSLLPARPSAYRRHHSTETAVLICTTISSAQSTVASSFLSSCST